VKLGVTVRYMYIVLTHSRMNCFPVEVLVKLGVTYCQLRYMYIVLTHSRMNCFSVEVTFSLYMN